MNVNIRYNLSESLTGKIAAKYLFIRMVKKLTLLIGKKSYGKAGGQI